MLGWRERQGVGTGEEVCGRVGQSGGCCRKEQGEQCKRYVGWKAGGGQRGRAGRVAQWGTADGIGGKVQLQA